MFLMCGMRFCILKFCLHFLTILHATFILLDQPNDLHIPYVLCKHCVYSSCCSVTHLLLHHHIDHLFTDVSCDMYNILSTFLVAIMLRACSSLITINNGGYN